MSRHDRSTHTTSDPAASLPATLRLGAVHLTVSHLDSSVAFYADAIGLRLHRREDSVAAMGVGEEDLLFLYEEQDTRRAGRPPASTTTRSSTPPVRSWRARRCVWR